MIGGMRWGQNKQVLTKHRTHAQPHTASVVMTKPTDMATACHRSGSRARWRSLVAITSMSSISLRNGDGWGRQHTSEGQVKREKENRAFDALGNPASHQEWSWRERMSQGQRERSGKVENHATPTCKHNIPKHNARARAHIHISRKARTTPLTPRCENLNARLRMPNNKHNRMEVGGVSLCEPFESTTALRGVFLCTTH